MAKRPSIFDRYWPFWALLGIGIGVRIWWLWAVDTQPITDFAWYFDRAVGLADGRGYTTEHGATAYWPVGYPFALSLVFRIFGASLWIAKVFNSVCCIGCSLLTAAIAYRSMGSRVVSFLAGLAVTLSPGFVAYSGILASEPLYTLAILASVWLALWARSYTRWGFAGIAIGIATLVRPQAILSAFALGGVPRPDSRRPRLWLAIGLCLIVAMAITSPWILRNKRTHGKWIFISTNGGDNLWIGQNPMATGTYMIPPGRPDTPAKENSIDAFGRYDGAKEMVKNWPHPLTLVGPKLKATFATPSDITYWAFQTDRTRLMMPGTGPERPMFLWARGIAEAYTFWLLVAAGIGLVVGWFSPSGRRLIWIAAPHILVTALVTIVFFGNGRFALPTIPFQVLLVVAGISAGLEWRKLIRPPEPNNYGYRL